MCRGREVRCGGRTLVMGILNVTPDSFSDGGCHLDPGRAVERALRMLDEGADVIDIGGESTRPGAQPVDAVEQIRRVVPVVSALRPQCGGLISVDTRDAQVARAALDAGAEIINDVSALGDPAMAEAVVQSGAGLVLMHMRGTPQTMQDDPCYGDVVHEVADFLHRRIGVAVECGVSPEQIAIDPGIGFGKTAVHNANLLQGLPMLASAGRPVVIGASRKRCIGQWLGREAGERLAGSLAVAGFAARNGAHILRVHDVIETCDVVRIADILEDR